MDKKKEMSLVMRIMSYFEMTRSQCMKEYKELNKERGLLMSLIQWDFRQLLRKRHEIPIH